MANVYKDRPYCTAALSRHRCQKFLLFIVAIFCAALLAFGFNTSVSFAVDTVNDEPVGTPKESAAISTKAETTTLDALDEMNSEDQPTVVGDDAPLENASSSFNGAAEGHQPSEEGEAPVQESDADPRVAGQSYAIKGITGWFAEITFHGYGYQSTKPGRSLFLRQW